MPARVVLLLLLAGLGALSSLQAEGPPRPEDKAGSAGAKGLWSLVPPRKSAPPTVQNKDWPINPIDTFVLAKLEATGLTPSPRADKLMLLRRVTLDLTGLPPTVAEQEAFLADPAADAYLKVVDRLLASPRYGERWAQHWLDLVRYAETDGFNADEFRPAAHKYRDYIIQALNDDLPYDRFIRQQLAGDELEPDNPQALIATGFNRLWPDEWNAANLEQRRQEILDDVTDVTGAVFLGLTIGCARCHDHKFDPILQTDYYRLQAFFAPLLPRDDLVAADSRQKQEYVMQREAWEKATQDLRAQMETMAAGKRADLRRYTLSRFRQEIQQSVLTPEEKRTPYQSQIAAMAEKQLQRSERDTATKLPADKKKLYQELEKKLAAVEPKCPPPLPRVMAVTDVGRDAPPTHRLAGGDWRKPREELQPGFPLSLGDARPDMHLDGGRATTGRRSALARWLTRPDHPLTARVMVNRLWQHHFGTGIVATSNDFGTQGETPTHPELLDWLAIEFVEQGWSLKHMHRLMVTSATYCQTSIVPRNDPRLAKDRENNLLWHARRQRLEGEAIRDAMLRLSGELNDRMFGPSAKPHLPVDLSRYSWQPDVRPEDQNRRSVYVLAKRNLRYPLFDAFDLPDMHNSCGRRTRTTTAPQALLLLNGEFALERAQRWSVALLAQFPKDERGLIAEAYRAAWGRLAQDEEIELARKFLDRQSAVLGDREGKPARSAALVDFCHALLNANEFLYVD